MRQIDRVVTLCQNLRMGKKGQAMLMIATMLMTFIMLFAFVINTGMLVNAKINLQNAADMAAYAGAAVQARQLNSISFVNYEMRREYKKFLFRYYVAGTMGQTTFPTNAPSPDGARMWSPDGLPANDHKVPAVCLALDRNDNYCKIRELRHISAPPASPSDVINGTLKQALGNIEKLRQGGCRGIGYANVQALLLWLFNTDPDLKTLQADLAALGGASGDQQRRIELMQTRSKGLGLVPAEFLLGLRIETLKGYVNQKARTGLTRAGMTALETTLDPAAHERTIQAFYSAYNTLGTHTFSDNTSIQMDEILPAGSNNDANLLELEGITTGFDTYAVNFGRRTPGMSDDQVCKVSDDPALSSEIPQDCITCLLPIKLSPNTLIVGFKKKPSVITHYAVKLSAKANILFSPFIGDLTLTAYSAAKPFGSRIGDPDFDPATLTHVGSNPDFCDPTATGLSEPNCIGKIPNLPFVVGEVATGNNWGWNRLRRQHAMYRNLIERNSQGSPGGTDIKIPALNRGYEAAMAPNPIEAGKYNILINDTQSASSNWKECNPLKPGLAFQCDFFSEHFNENGAYSIWAPIFPPNDRDPEKMKATLKDFFKTFEDRQGTLKAVFNDAFKDALIQSMVKYVQGIENGPDPSGNSINILKIKDPFNHHVEGGEIEPITFAGDPSLLLDPSSPQNFKTSWNANRDQNWNRTGRIGYSVKFVSFNSLATSAGATNTGGVATGLDGIQH